MNTDFLLVGATVNCVLTEQSDGSLLMRPLNSDPDDLIQEFNKLRHGGLLFRYSGSNGPPYVLVVESVKE